MLRLKLNPEPTWIDLGHGVEVEALPVTSGIITGARARPEYRALPDDATADQKIWHLTTGVALATIIDWRGVGGAEGDDPLAVTPEGIAALMELYPLALAFYQRHVVSGLVVDAEKNGSAPSLTGTSAAATNTAAPAPDSAQPALN